MDTLSLHAPKSKPHYVYTLAYPESMGGCVFYVGKGTGKRINDHEREARNGAKSYKCNVIRKIWHHSEQLVKNKIAHFETHAEACQYEMALIFFLPGLTNLTAGGDGTVGIVVPDEIRIKRNQSISHANKKSKRVQEQLAGLRELQKGIPRTPEVKAKISEKLTGRPGTPHSEESKAKISASNTGRVIPEKTRRAVGEANRARMLTDDQRRRMSDERKQRAPHPAAISAMQARNLGSHPSDSARKKMHDAKCRLTDGQAAIVKFNAYGWLQREYAQLFGVSESAIGLIATGKTYKHITIEHLPPMEGVILVQRTLPVRDKGRFVKGEDNGWRERERDASGHFLPRKRNGGDAQ